MNGVAGSVDTLQENSDSMAVDTEENLQTQLELAAKHPTVPLFDNLQLRWNDLRVKKTSDQTPPFDALPSTLLPYVPPSRVIPSIPPQVGLYKYQTHQLQLFLCIAVLRLFHI